MDHRDDDLCDQSSGATTVRISCKACINGRQRSICSDCFLKAARKSRKDLVRFRAYSRAPHRMRPATGSEPPNQEDRF
jgi:hypothetical protein